MTLGDEAYGFLGHFSTVLGPASLNCDCSSEIWLPGMGLAHFRAQPGMATGQHIAENTVHTNSQHVSAVQVLH